MLAQSADVDLYCVFRHIFVIGKQPVKKFVFGEHLTWRIDQKLKQSQLPIAQRDRHSVNNQATCDRVKGDISQPNRRLRCARFPAQNRAAPRL